MKTTIEPGLKCIQFEPYPVWQDQTGELLTECVVCNRPRYLDQIAHCENCGVQVCRRCAKFVCLKPNLEPAYVCGSDCGIELLKSKKCCD